MDNFYWSSSSLTLASIFSNLILSPISKFSIPVIYTFQLWNFHLIFLIVSISQMKFPMWIHCVCIFKSLSIFVTAALKSLSTRCDAWIISESVSIDYVFPLSKYHIFLFLYMYSNFFLLDFSLWFSGCSVGLKLHPSTPSVCVLDPRLENALRQKPINKCHPLSFKVRFIQFLPVSGYSTILSDCPISSLFPVDDQASPSLTETGI